MGSVEPLLSRILRLNCSGMVWPWRSSRRRIARVCLEGPIAGSTRERVLKALRQVEERRFPALLLRIDSPGGTVGDSQEIHAALHRLRERDCHVVAHFGNISASGGVYVGVAAEKVVANPGTITGSIGVILRGNNLSRLLERIGIRFETVKSGLYKDILSPDRALTEDERRLLQDLIDSSYDQFVTAVAEGRSLTPDAVRAFADGRVFSGAQALELGLVDELGDEEHARRLAARLAGLDEEHSRPVTLGRNRRRLAGLIPGRSMLAEIRRLLSLELAWSGQVLWLYRP
jgi:protease-4